MDRCTVAKGATTGGSGGQDPLNIFIDPSILNRFFHGGGRFSSVTLQ